MENSYAITAQNNHAYYNVKHLVCNTSGDVDSVPTTAAPGSTLFCIETSESYMLNTQKQWVKVTLPCGCDGGGSGGGGGGDIPDDYEYATEPDIDNLFPELM